MASGQTVDKFHTYNNEIPAANFASFDTRNSTYVIDFDDTTQEYAVFKSVLDRAYSNGGVNVNIYWTSTSAISGSVVWSVEFELMNTDIDSDSFAAAQTVVSPANGSSGIPILATVAFTNGAQMDNVTAGSLYRMRVSRVPSNGSDDMVGDAELHMIEIVEV